MLELILWVRYDYTLDFDTILAARRDIGMRLRRLSRKICIFV